MCKFDLKDATLGAHFEIEFDSDSIELDIPQTGQLKDGWAIDPLVYPEVRWYLVVMDYETLISYSGNAHLVSVSNLQASTALTSATVILGPAMASLHSDNQKGG